MKPRAALFSTTDLLLLVVVFLWALNYTVVKNSISSGLPPLVFTALRFTLAAIILLPLLRSLTPAERAVSRSDWWKIAGLGLLGNSLYQIFFIIAIDHSTPTNIALILATPPIFIALLGALFKLEWLNGLAWLGIGLSFGGIALVILGSSAVETAGSASNPLLGDVLALIAALMWALYTLLVAPVLKRHVPIKITALTVGVGTVPLIAVALPAFLTMNWASVEPTAWLGVLYSGGLAIAVGYLLWNRGVQQVGAARTAVYSNLTPVAAALIAWAVRGDPLTVYEIAGAVLVLTGITLTRMGRRKKF